MAMDIKAAYEVAGDAKSHSGVVQMEAIGVILSRPWGIGSQALLEYLAQGVGALCLDRAKQLKGEA